MAQYNSDVYNDTQYNLTAFAVGLLETITPSDSLSKSIEIVKTDSEALADVISDGVNMAAMLETVNILQRARTPHPYNSGLYNWYMYNTRLDDDEILLMAQKALTDSFTSSDAITSISMIKEQLETLTPSDSLAMTNILAPFIEFLFSFDAVQREISNKALYDTIRINDWLTIRHTPFVEYWND
jgi:hypothetical protein